MSNKVSNLVYSRRVGSPHRKAILAYMADKASDDGRNVFCSKGTVADQTEVARSTVFKIVKQLVDEGVLIKDGCRSCRNGHTVVYHLNLEVIRAFPAIASHRGDVLDRSGERTSPLRQTDPYRSDSRTQTSLGTTLESDEDDAASVSAPQVNDPTEREELLAAIGVTSMDARGRIYGNMTDMAEVSRWAGMGLTHPQQIQVIRETMSRKPGGTPPSSFRYFTPAMQAAAADLSRPALQPVTRVPAFSNQQITPLKFDLSKYGNDK